MSAGPHPSRASQPPGGSRRAWPEPAQFNEAVQNLASSTSDGELRGGEPELNALGMPAPYAGAFADVYKVHCPATGNTWAVKFFKREVRNLRERYRAISDHLIVSQLPFMVDFRYIEEGVRISGAWYPLVKMRWIEGQTLNRFVAQSLHQPKMLEQIFQLWIKVAARLRGAGIAHADLQHGNVVLVPQGDQGRLLLKLIDYDGMYVPALSGQQSGELGHANFQHPQREVTKAYNAELDRFSHLAICCALRCLSVGGLPLWERFNNHENLLFTAQDFADPANSKLFRELWTLRHPDAHALVGRLALATQLPLEQSPLIEEIVQDNRVRTLTGEEQQAAQSLLVGMGWTPAAVGQPGATTAPAPMPVSRPEPAPALAPPTTAPTPVAQNEGPTKATRPRLFSPLSALLWVVRGVDGLLSRCAGQDNALLHNYFRLIFVLVLLMGLPFASRLVHGFLQDRWERSRIARAEELRQAALQELAQARRLWLGALERADVDLFTAHAARTYQSAHEAAQSAENLAASEDSVAATEAFRQASQKLSQAETETVAALGTELEAALAESDSDLALQHLATIKKLRPGESRLASWESQLVSLTGGPLPSDETKLDASSFTSSIGMKLVRVQAGEFVMGSVDDGNSDADERPQHRVRISRDFYLGVYEVTQDEYSAVAGKNPSKFKGSDLPVEQVSATDADEFCRLLTEHERKAGKLPERMIYRLPTEAEWEYAARAGTTTTWFFGDDEQKFDAAGWCDKNSTARSHTVGSKTPNAWGLYDVAGNVEEWVLDVHRAGSYAQRTAAVTTDPVVQDAGEFSRVVRGGGWNNSTQACRSAFRNSTGAAYSHPSLGFRVALAWEKGLSPSPQTPATPAVVVNPPTPMPSPPTATLPDTITSTIGMKLKRIKAGVFMMGSNAGGETAEPEHAVRISQDYYLGIYEVTQAEYRAITGLRPSYSRGDDFPVEQVTPTEALEFCKLLTNKDRAASRLPEGMIYDLPSEAQWEYAARAGAKTPSFFGDDRQIGDYAWYDGNSRLNGALAVGQKKPNAWGLYDMAGNVGEWTRDEYRDLNDLYNAYRQRKGTTIDPEVRNSGYRVARGGDWGNSAFNCQAVHRTLYLNTSKSSQFGFRVAAVKESGTTDTSAASSSSSTPPDTSPTIPGFKGRSGSTRSKLEDKTEFPFPTLPAGAGKIDADASKTFSTTASGVKYRILRKGTGAVPRSGTTIKLHIFTWSDDGKTTTTTNTYDMGALTMPFDSFVQPQQPQSAELVKLLQATRAGGMVQISNHDKDMGNVPNQMVLELLEVR